MARRQLAIAGTEPEVNQDLEDKAQIYRGHMLDRMKFGKLEAEAKVMLDAEIEKQVKDKRIKLPPEAGQGKVVTIYTYHDDEDGPLEVKYGRKSQVRVRKAKPASAAADASEDLIEDEEDHSS